MSGRIAENLRSFVEQRAESRCEYCRLHSDDAFLSHEADHIIARKHGGKSTFENLAWACFLCNRYKGTDIASIDPDSGEVVPLFHPRQDRWAEHFRYEEGFIVPLTATGRATQRLLRFNRPESIELRLRLADDSRYP